MKKYALLTVIFALFLTSNAAAQFKAPKPKVSNLTNQQKMIPFALGMALSVLREDYDENHYQIVVILQQKISNWSKELKFVVDLKDEQNKKLREFVVEDAVKDILLKSTASDSWQIKLGANFGPLFTNISKAKAQNTKPDSEYIKSRIEMIVEMSANAPDDIPWDVVDKLKKFDQLSSIEDFSTDKNIDLLISKVLEVLEVANKE